MIDWSKPIRGFRSKIVKRVLCLDGEGQYPVILYTPLTDTITRCMLDGTKYSRPFVENIPPPLVKDMEIVMWRATTGLHGVCVQAVNKGWVCPGIVMARVPLTIKEGDGL